MRKNIPAAYGLCLVVLSAPAWSAGNDELWEITTTMKMQGMAMPGMKTKSCIAKDGAYNPDADKKDKNCTTTDYKVSGNTVKWAMKCTGKNAMSGSGEMTRTADSMKGTFNMQAEGMAMVQVMEGKRVGTCDAGEEKKKTDKMIADSKAQGEDAIKKMCERLVKDDAESGGTANTAGMYQGKEQCVSYKPQLCEQARAQVGSYAGYSHYIQSRGRATKEHRQWGWVVSECGINLDKTLATLCDKAAVDKQYRFIGNYCPILAKALSGQHCAGFGLDYTADIARPNAAMCSALRAKSRNQAGQEDDDGNAAGASSASPGKAAGTESKSADKPADTTGSKLKKMFGF
jgi:hypothetical protein